MALAYDFVAAVPTSDVADVFLFVKSSRKLSDIIFREAIVPENEDLSFEIRVILESN